MNVFLIGFMGAGKSAVGKILAKKMNATFLDTDTWIETKNNESVSTIFSEKGEDFFRKEEERCFFELSENQNQVVACGGGFPIFNDLMQRMKLNGLVVFLNIPLEILVGRLSKNNAARPLVQNKSKEEIKNVLKEQQTKRLPCYLTADIIFNPEKFNKDQIANQILEVILKYNYSK